MFGINTIIEKHFKMLLRDMNDKPFDKIKGRYTLNDSFVIFMLFINGIFDFVERRAESFGKLFKEDFTKIITKKVIVKVFNSSPRSKVATPSEIREWM